MRNLKSIIFRGSTVLIKKSLFKTSYCQAAPSRLLFTPESLKIISFAENCKNVKSTICDAENFKEEMKKKCEKDINYLIFLDDLKKMIRIAETDDDLLLVINMAKKFCTQSNVIRFGSFTFGPEIMRLYYLLNKPTEALKLVTNPETTLIFREVTSLLILATLLFKNEMYEEVIQLFHIMIEKQFQGKKFPHNLVIMYFASCYKLNTPESFDKALNLWKTFLEVGFVKCPMRGIWFLSTLALKQNQPDTALDILTNAKPTAVGKNIQIMALADKKQYNQVLNLLNELLFSDVPNIVSHNFLTADTVDHLEKAFKNTSEENSKNFEKINKELVAHNFVRKEVLETYLCEEIVYAQKKSEGKYKAKFNKKFFQQ